MAITRKQLLKVLETARYGLMNEWIHSGNEISRRDVIQYNAAARAVIALEKHLGVEVLTNLESMPEKGA